MVISLVTVLKVHLDERVMWPSWQLAVESHLPLRRNRRPDDVIRRCYPGIDQCVDHLDLGMVAAGHPVDKNGRGTIFNGLRIPDGPPVLLNSPTKRRTGH